MPSSSRRRSAASTAEADLAGRRWGLTREAWDHAVTDAVRSSTAAQGLPELVADEAVLEAIARILQARASVEPGGEAAMTSPDADR